MEKREQKCCVMQEKNKIIVMLEAMSEQNIGGYQLYFDELKQKIELLFEQEDISKKIQQNEERFQWIGAYLEEMQKDHQIFYEEPCLEEYEGQEILWPTTLSLWKEDMEEILEEIAS